MGIEKGAVIQEARVFNDPQLDPRRCSCLGFAPSDCLVVFANTEHIVDCLVVHLPSALAQ
ncbi:unnamed protein product [Arabis nemorensis]|uniref:Uncharacterized protein n=1 Tax=Arabis nemorensis TaxID=586526 RepID=A0A565AML1_9BRAS|nr:unnamed protein product [Arabis nemorensis]